MPNKPTITIVEWDDAHGDSVMFGPEEMEHKPYRFTLIGWLIKSDEVGVSLAQEIGEDGRFRGHSFIPRRMVFDEYSVSGRRKKIIPPKLLPTREQKQEPL